MWGLAATSLLVADKEGMLTPYAPEGLDKIRANFKDSQNPPHWVGIDSWFSAFCVNTTELAAKNLPLPTSWDDLLKPEYKGLIVMPNPNSSGTGYLSVSAILQLKGEAEGWKYLDKLNDNIAVYTHSGSKPCKMAGAGETAIGISFDYRAIKQKADGRAHRGGLPGGRFRLGNGSECAGQKGRDQPGRPDLPGLGDQPRNHEGIRQELPDHGCGHRRSDPSGLPGRSHQATDQERPGAGRG